MSARGVMPGIKIMRMSMNARRTCIMLVPLSGIYGTLVSVYPPPIQFVNKPEITNVVRPFKVAWWGLGEAKASHYMLTFANNVGTDPQRASSNLVSVTTNRAD